MTELERLKQHLKLVEAGGHTDEVLDCLGKIIFESQANDDWETARAYAVQLSEVAHSFKNDKSKMQMNLRFALETQAEAAAQTAFDKRTREIALQEASSCLQQLKDAGCSQAQTSRILFVTASLLRQLERFTEAQKILEKLYAGAKEPFAPGREPILRELAQVARALGDSRKADEYEELLAEDQKNLDECIDWASKQKSSDLMIRVAMILGPILAVAGLVMATHYWG